MPIIESIKNITDIKLPEREVKDISLRDVYDLIETVDAAPTFTPTSFFNQFKIYKSGSTKRFYWYDNTNGEWSYVTGT